MVAQLSDGGCSPMICVGHRWLSAAINICVIADARNSNRETAIPTCTWRRQ